MLRALAAIGAIALLIGGSASAAAAADEGAEGSVDFTVPAHVTATEIWVDVEEPDITAADVVMEVDGAVQTPVDTVLGVSLVVPATGAQQQITVTVTRVSSPDIALTVIDATGTILHSAHERIIATAEPGTVSPTPEPGASAGPTTGSPAGGGGEGGALATTGSDAGLSAWAALVAGVALTLGIALVARRAVRAVGVAAPGERSER